MTQTLRNLLAKIIMPFIWPWWVGFICGGLLVWVLFVLVR